MIESYFLYKNLPSIDLHGCDRVEALIKVKEFINDSYKLGVPLVSVVHGKGAYILKDDIHKYLKSSKLVVAYKIDIYNAGTTIIEIIKRN